ncbi:asparagine synthase (glutamine-hydrolyzing) [Haliangium sp.]|uniref:asparagine synthase (glutamine-hydrolyzing) n=1 Tax=Haliangium sp. TaxID=2663208 RepID=UPI003D13F8E1
MCGVVASWRPDGRASHTDPARAPAVAVSAGIRALGHRGPDGAGAWVGADGRVALGHTRLAVTSPADGDQPVASEDGLVVAAVNGEIYAHAQLRAALARAGHRFRTGSDSELLVHLYEEHGLDCLDALTGEFGFALWDGRARRLIAARDRFGAKTLVWRRAGNGVDLASEAKALFAMGAPARWDTEAMAWAMTMQYLPPDRTVFEGVSMLPPGALLCVRAGASDGAAEVEVRRWAPPLWRPQAELAPLDDPAAAVRRFRNTFVDAVSERVDTGARLCFHLSGGVDSAAVLGAAAQALGRRLDAFTVSFPGSALDELALARDNADHAGAALHPVALTSGDLLDGLCDAARAGEGLAINGHLTSHFLMNRAIARAGFQVVLSGEGADELAAGYPHLRQDLAHLGGAELAADDSADCRGIMLAHGEGLSTAGVEARLGFVPAFVAAKAGIGARLRQVASAEYLAAEPAPEARLGALIDPDEAADLRRLHRVDASLTLWTRLALGGYILPTLSDRLQGAHGLEGRLPFLDPRLHAVVSALPLEARIRAGVEKWILREAVRGLVPEATRTRRKHPFLAPALDGDPATRARIDAMLADFRARRFFDPAALTRHADRLAGVDPAERAAWGPVFLLALTAHALGLAYALE